MYSIMYPFLIRRDLLCILFTLQTHTNCSEPPTDCTCAGRHKAVLHPFQPPPKPFFWRFLAVTKSPWPKPSSSSSSSSSSLSSSTQNDHLFKTPQVVSTSTHWSKGNVDRELVAFAIFGALLGGFLGGSIAAILPERALRLIFVPWEPESRFTKRGQEREEFLLLPCFFFFWMSLLEDLVVILSFF